MKKILVLGYIVIAIFWSCGNSRDGVMAKDDRLKIIEDIENEAFGEGGAFDATKALALINNYAKFAQENPEDDETPKFLFKAGDFSMGLEKGDQAIMYFDQIITSYPEFEKLPYCLFLKGFVYENQLKDMDRARDVYIEFLDKYPNHEMAESARFSLKNLGKTPEELIREFEKNQPVVNPS